MFGSQNDYLKQGQIPPGLLCHHGIWERCEVNIENNLHILGNLSKIPNPIGIEFEPSICEYIVFLALEVEGGAFH